MDLGGGAKYGHVAYQIKPNDAHAATYGSIYFARRPHPPRGCGQNSTFSEHGHIAYKIKENNECSNTQAHILSLHTPLAPGVGSKVKTVFFLKVVVLHIKLKGMEHRPPCKHIFCPYAHPRPDGCGQMSEYFFSESSQTNQRKEALSTMQAHILFLHTPSTPGFRAKGQSIFF